MNKIYKRFIIKGKIDCLHLKIISEKKTIRLNYIIKLFLNILNNM